MAPRPCLLCQTGLESFQSKKDNLVYGVCPHCRWISLEEVHILPPEKQKARYLQHENSVEKVGYVGMFEDFIEACVDPFIPAGGAVLDFGCGPEPVLAGLLRQRGWDTETYDPFFDPDGGTTGKKYDAILLTEVLEHLPDPLEILRGLIPRLKPEGIFALMTLFHPDRMEAFDTWWYRRDSTHVTFYTLKTIGRLAESLGMKIVFSDSKRTAVLTGSGGKP